MDSITRIASVITGWQKANQKKTYVITTSAMKDDLEKALFLELIKANQKSGDILYATDSLFVNTLEELAISELQAVSPVTKAPVLTMSLRAQVVEQVLSQIDKLEVFNKIKNQQKSGFNLELAKLFERFERGGWDYETFKELTPENEGLKKKFADIAKIYQQYSRQVAAYQSTSSLLDTLKDNLDLLGKFNLYYVGPKNLENKHEYELLQLMMKQAGDNFMASFIPTYNQSQTKRGQVAQFGLTLESEFDFNKLKEIKQLFKYVNESSYGDQKPQLESYTITEALDKNLEAKWVASQVKKQVTSNDGVRLRDIVIYTPKTDEVLLDQLDLTLTQLKLAHNANKATDLRNTPLAQLLQSLFASEKERYSIENMVRLINSGLVIGDLIEDKAEMTATEILKRNIKANRNFRPELIEFIKDNNISTKDAWENAELWQIQIDADASQDQQDFAHAKSQKLRQVRDRILGIFKELDDEDIPMLDRLNVITAENHAKGKFSIYEVNKKKSQLLNLMIRQKSNQENEENAPITRLGATMSEAMKRFFDLKKSLENQEETDLSFEKMARKFDEIFSEPFSERGDNPSIDEITITTVDQAQLPKYKHAYFMGMDESQYPGKLTHGRILTLDDEEDAVFADKSRMFKTYREAYHNLSDQLYYALQTAPNIHFSYAVNDIKGDFQKPSPYYLGIKAVKEEFEEKVDLQTIFGIPNFDMNAIIQQAKQNDKKQTITLPKGSQTKFDKYAELMNYRNQPQEIGEKLAHALFLKKDKDVLVTSYTAFEKLAENPYEYFLKYGLGLYEPTEEGVTASGVGTYVHSLLENAVNQELPKGKDEEEEHLNDIIEKANNLDDNDSRDKDRLKAILETFKANKRNEFFKQRIDETFKKYWRNHLKNMDDYKAQYKAQVSLTEVKFVHNPADEKTLEGPVVQLDNGIQVVFTGLIDRLDKVEVGDKTYLNVIDYKTGNARAIMKDYDLKIKNGLKAQVLLYEMALKQNEAKLKERFNLDEVNFGAMAYSGVNSEMSDANLKGLWTDEFFQAIKDLDQIYQVKVGNKKLENAMYPEIEKYEEEVQAVIKSRFEEILAGKIELRPMRLLDKDGKSKADGLKFSSYKAIMNFNEEAGNRYFDIKREESDDE